MQKNNDIPTIARMVFQDLRDRGCAPGSVLELGLHMVRLFGRLYVEETRGDGTALAAYSDKLRRMINLDIQDLYRYRNERFPLG